MRILYGLAVCFLLAGCASLPSSGPSANAVVTAGSSTGESRPFELIDLNESTLSVLASVGPTPLSGQFRNSRPSPVQTIGVGDTVVVTIFEAGNGGLFSASESQLGRGSKSAPLPPQAVEADGTIGIPFAGRIRASGRTPSQVSDDIVTRLEGKALDPQAIVTVERGQSNLATVSGKVGAPARVPLSPSGDRVLDVLSMAGGPSGNPNELFIQVSRGANTAVSPLRAIIENPSENIYIWPNDTITVFREPQVFTAFGASGASGNFPFEYERMTLMEAVGAAKGIDDNRADPAGVFVYRLERGEVVCALLGEEPCDLMKARVPVVYRLNLREPGGIFHAQRMLVRNKDVLYVANAGSTELLKFLRLLGTAVGNVGAGAGLANSLN